MVDIKLCCLCQLVLQPDLLLPLYPLLPPPPVSVSLLSSSVSIFLEESEDGGGGVGDLSAGAPWGGGYLMGLCLGNRVAARSMNTNYVKYYVCSLETRCTRSEIKKQ